MFTEHLFCVLILFQGFASLVIAFTVVFLNVQEPVFLLGYAVYQKISICMDRPEELSIVETCHLCHGTELSPQFRSRLNIYLLPVVVIRVYIAANA